MKKLVVVVIALILLIKMPVLAQQEIEMLIFNRDYQKALSLIQAEISANPSADLYYKKGLVLNSQQNYAEAILAFQNAIQTDSVNPIIMAELAESYAVLGNYHDAAYWFEKTTALQPENLSLLAKNGRNYISLKDFQKAYNCFSVAYAKDSTNIYWNKQLAFSAFRVGKRKQAIELYTKVLEMNPRDYSTYFNLIRTFDKQKEDTLITALFEKGLTNFPGDAELFGERARFYFETKKYDLAKPDFESYFQAGGDSVYTVLMNYGIACYFAGNDSLAVQILEKCVDQIVNDEYVLFYLALSYKRLKDFVISEQYMEAAIEAATPAYLPDMYHYLGQILGQQRKFAESIAALQKANELDAENAEVLFEIATTYEEYNNNKTLALNYYRLYLLQAGEEGENVKYALDRMKKLKEDLFFEE
jgi:tetratricopeptide (TPR) repeat protein